MSDIADTTSSAVFEDSEQRLEQARACDEQAVAVAVFPELSLTGYSIDDLLLQDVLLRDVEAALADLAGALELLADTPSPPTDTVVEERPDGLRLIERRRPVGVVGANFEARPNVVVDVASQLIKSRNAGVLRTGCPFSPNTSQKVTGNDW